MKKYSEMNPDEFYILNKMLNKILRRRGLTVPQYIIDKIYVEYYRRGKTGDFIICRLSLDNKTIGIGVSKRSDPDKFTMSVGFDIAIWNALNDFLSIYKVASRCGDYHITERPTMFANIVTRPLWNAHMSTL